MASSGILTSFLGALQAGLSVLLTVCFGVVGAQFKLVSTEAAEEISQLGVKLLLPCLLIANLGSELHLDNAINYVPIIIWATIFTTGSIVIGRLATGLFRLPQWAVSAIAFNNTQSLPLLLLQSLEMTGVLSDLTGPEDGSDPIKRAKSYFLACSVINTTITFAIGPQILNSPAEDSYLVRVARWMTGGSKPSDPDEQADPEDPDSSRRRGQQSSEDASSNSTLTDNEEGGDNAPPPNEHTSLLPNRVVHWEHEAEDAVESRLERLYRASPKPIQYIVRATKPFLNPPFIGAAIGVIIGLVPPLHRLFFNDMNHGGYFSAWITSSTKNVGELFVSLQVIIVGVKLSLSLRKLKKGEEGGSLPWGTVACVTFIRFIFWPLISIPVIWALAAHTNVLPNDPVLWWAMMMMPVGPTAMKTLALADVSGTSQKVRMSIALFLTVSYIITPLIAFSVVGALEAAKAAR
ncbi:auxin efflux carrier [Xylariomycetidae sp. FL0641]|nr:auxin efflux carrier [Xylariomycetidae sp. FL0641]